MPRYEFRCRECDATFEVERPMSAASDPADCPDGHHDTVKLLTSVALNGRTGRGAKSSMSSGAAQAARASGATMSAGGGCCGGGCCG